MTVVFFFFFSSRRRHTRCSRDWSSDVCSSDLLVEAQVEADLRVKILVDATMISQPPTAGGDLVVVGHHRAAVAHDREVLGRIERENGRTAEAADLLAQPLGPVGLRAVLEEPHAQPRGRLTE